MHCLHVRRRPPQCPLRSELQPVHHREADRYSQVYHHMAEYVNEAEAHKEGPQEIRAIVKRPPILDHDLERELPRRPISIVPALPQRRLPLLQTAHLPRHHRRRLPLIILRKAIAPVLDQLEDAVLAPLHQRPMQRCKPHVISCIHARAPPQQKIDHGTVPLVRRPHQTRVPLRIHDVHGYILVQQQRNLEHIPVQRRAMQQIEPLIIRQQRVCPVLQQQIHNVVVALLRGPQHGCCDCVSTFCVDVCAALDQEVAQRVVVVYRGPVEGCDALLVGVRGVVGAAVEQALYCTDLPQSCKLHDILLHR